MRWPWKRKDAEARTARGQTGRAAERAAARFLRKCGHRILAQNVRYRQGEVDLVAMEKRTGTVCFVEVRSRTISEGKDPPVPLEETITPAKRRRVISAARTFLVQRGALERPIRFDVVTVRFHGAGDKRPEIRHFPGAFDAAGR